MTDGGSPVVAGSRQQQAGDELAGRGGVHRHLAPGEVTPAVHGQRHPVAVDGRAQGPQRVQQRGERTLPHARVAVENHVTVRQRGQRGGEPGDGTGVAAVDPGGRGRLQRTAAMDQPVIMIVDNGHAELAEGSGHEQGVPGP